MRSARAGSVAIHMDAPAELVWGLLADVERMSQWSPECYRVAWLDGASSPATRGARFRGWNRYGLLRWSMCCRVKSAVPTSEISWTTLAGDREMTTWAYHLRPSGGGVDVVESFDVHWYSVPARIAEDFLMRDRDRRRLEGMRTTLIRIKQLVEAASRDEVRVAN